MKSLVAALSAALLLSGCAQRPFYRDVVASPEGVLPAAGTEAMELVVLDSETNRPVEGARVSWMESGRRVRTVTNAAGTFRLNVSPVLAAQNPVIEVVLPAGVTGYRLARPEALAPQGGELAPVVPDES